SAQKTPPTAVMTAFNQKFPDMKDVDWGLEKNGQWEAEFDQNGVDMSADFSAEGTWLETETQIKVADLPAAVKTALNAKKVKEAARIQRADGSTVYEAEVRHKDLLFDASGKMVN
ncbi:MAG: PepSY-like domain-containing protein, partial [Saprospiraceae bacterium]|nr:PepSY-like domain-containing protein [Saprospiraceae bacterium]